MCVTPIHFIQSDSVRYDTSPLHSNGRTPMCVCVCACVRGRAPPELPLTGAGVRGRGTLLFRTFWRMTPLECTVHGGGVE